MRALRAVAYLTNALQVRTIVARHQSRRRSPAGFILKVHIVIGRRDPSQ
jgi:primosomal replication protein N